MSQSVNLLLVLVITISMLKGGSAQNILMAGNALSQSQYLNNANYSLILQNDCNLVLYNDSTVTDSEAIWSTNTSNQGNNFCTFQVDTGGFLSIYNASTSSDLSHSYDGTVPHLNDVATPGPGQVVSSPSNSSEPTIPSLSVYGPYWDFVTRGHTFNVSYMPRGYYLSEGSLSSGDYFLTMEDNCTLQIIATNGSIIWQFPTPGNSHCVLTLQQNGTLQLQTNDTHYFVSDVDSASGD
ncbi:unnamed protein product, partial [Sphagnum troendelagicum]